MERLCIFDLETTGLSAAHGHRAIEIGIVEIIDRKITDNTFHVYINPDREIDARAQQVHGITSEFLADKPRFSEVVDKMCQFIKGSTMIAHNASFDESFLTMELARLGLPPLEKHCSEIVDSLVIARKLYPGKKNSLDALCKRLDVVNSHRQYHGALLDSELLAHVYLKMTGGQETLSFDEEPSQHQAATTKAKVYKVKAATITSDELNAHRTWCDKLKKDSKPCLFQD